MVLAKVIWSLIVNLIKLFDNFMNVVLAPVLNWWFKPKYKFGYYRDPLSEVFGRNVETCKFCKFMCKILALLQNKHCQKSIVDD